MPFRIISLPRCREQIQGNGLVSLQSDHSWQNHWLQHLSGSLLNNWHHFKRMCMHAHISTKKRAIMLRLSLQEPSVLCKTPSPVPPRGKDSWIPPGSIGTEFLPSTASEAASKHLARGSKRNVLYLFLTLSQRRALHKVTSDQLLLAGAFLLVFFSSLSRHLCRRGKQ